MPAASGPRSILKAVADGAAARLPGGRRSRGAAAARRACCGLLLPLAQVDAPADLAAVPPGALAVLRPPGLPAGLAELPWGRVDARCGAAAAACIEAAAALVLAGAGGGDGDRADPQGGAGRRRHRLSRPHRDAAGAGRTAGGAAPPVRMMLANDELRVVLVTHPRGAAPRDRRGELRVGAADDPHRPRRRAAWGQPRPRIAVAGLNPHAGEGGLFGDEEQRFIAPAVAAARAAGHRRAAARSRRTRCSCARAMPPAIPASSTSWSR